MAIAATIYDIPAELKEQCYKLLPIDLQNINAEFIQLIKQRNVIVLFLLTRQ